MVWKTFAINVLKSFKWQSLYNHTA